MRFAILLSLGLLTISFLVACQTLSDEAVSQLEKPVSCETAESDIAALEAEKVSAAERARKAARRQKTFSSGRTVQVVPAADVKRVLSRDHGPNDDLDAKIAEIRAACGL